MNFAQTRPNLTIVPPLESSRRALARGDGHGPGHGHGQKHPCLKKVWAQPKLILSIIGL